MKPVANYLRFPFSVTINVDEIFSKLTTFFSLESSAVENEELMFTNDIVIEIQSNIW